MSQSYKLSLTSAVIINMNIMLGAGIFLNPVVLSDYAGPLSPLTYFLIGTLLLPLILATSLLFQRVSGGSFYEFGTQISPYAGYISSVSYFFGKLASGALMLHFGMSFLQKLFPFLAEINLLTLDFIAIILFTIFNLIGLKIATQIQYLFLIAKLIPIAFIGIIGALYFKPYNMTLNLTHTSGLLYALPLVLYAFTGFEASTSLYHLLHNPEKNAPRAILYAFSLVLGITILFQGLFYMAIDTFQLGYTAYFDSLSLFTWSTIGHYPFILWLLQISVGLSALGGSYGILMSVHWNLYILAQKNRIPLSAYFTQLNTYGIAWVCVAIESIIIVLYLFFTKGSQIPLQQIGALGCVIAYTISILALLYAFLKEKNMAISSSSIAILAFITCLILLVVTIQGILISSLLPIIGLICILLFFSILYRVNEILKNPSK